MATLKTLKASARRSAEFRGHRLGNFKSYGKTSAMAMCKNSGCYCVAHVEINPRPNGIDISGNAVAINCESK